MRKAVPYLAGENIDALIEYARGRQPVLQPA